MSEFVILDLSPLKYRILLGHAKQDVIDDPGAFIHHMLDKILYLKKKLGCYDGKKLLLGVDKKKRLPNGRFNYWRDMLYDSYKPIMARHEKNLTKPRFNYYKERPKPEYTDLDMKKVSELYDEMIEFLDKYTDFDVLYSDGIECDDIMAYIAQSVPETTTVTVCSNDKDLRQFAKDNIKYYEPESDKYNKDVKSNYGNLIFFLKGDSTDGVPGVMPRHQWNKALTKIMTTQNITQEEAMYVEFKNLIFKKDVMLKVYSDRLGKQITRENILDLTEEEIKSIQLRNCDKVRIVNTCDYDDFVKRFKFNKKIMDLSISNLPPNVVNLIVENINKPRGCFNQFKTPSAISKFGLDKYVDGVKSIADRYEEFQLSAYPSSDSSGKKFSRGKRTDIEAEYGVTVVDDTDLNIF